MLTPEVKRRLAAQIEAGTTNGHTNGSGGEAGSQAVTNGVARGHGQSDAPACASWGWSMTRSGSCHPCGDCGDTSGCS